MFKISLTCGRNLSQSWRGHRISTVASRFQYGDDFGECLNHESINARRHGPDNDYIKFVDVGNNHILHTFEGADREGTGVR